MKVTRGKTVFEFTEEEIKAIRTCYALFNTIYDGMSEDELFCGFCDADLDNAIISLFVRMMDKFSRSNEITCD